MKESRYNHYYKMHDGADVVYNAISSTLAVIDDRYHELIRILPTVRESSDVPVQQKVFRAGHLNALGEAPASLVVRSCL